MKLALRDGPVIESVERIKLAPERRRPDRRAPRAKTFVRIQELRFEPPSLEARAFRELRLRLNLPESFLASAVGLREADLVALDEGRKVPVLKNGWRLAFRAMLDAARSLQTRSIG